MLLILFIFVYLQSLLFEAPVGTQASQTPSQCSYSLQTALSNCSRLLMSNLAAAASVRLAGDNSILSCTAGSSHHVCSWVTILTTCFFLQHAPVWKRHKELSAIITTSSMILCTAGFCLSSLCLRESTQIGKPSPPLCRSRDTGDALTIALSTQASLHKVNLCRRDYFPHTIIPLSAQQGLTFISELDLTR